jgi:hypothetical protein
MDKQRAASPRARESDCYLAELIDAEMARLSVRADPSHPRFKAPMLEDQATRLGI